jgi:cyclomaltodextrinase
VHALGAADGAGLGAITAWLDHVAALGCGGLLLTPIHASTSHGYDTIDPFVLDPRLGSEADFDALVSACRDRDIALVLDGVFNHVGRAFPRTDWLSGATFEGHDELPALDHRNPEVLEWAIAVAMHWLDRGASGWRFDVAYALPRAFLAELTARVRTAHPDALLFGEMIHGDYAGFVTATGLHSVTEYELYKAIWSSLNDGNMWELAWALDRHRAHCEVFAPVTFVGNHDVTRIASQLHSPGHFEHALAILFTVPGIPCVYYGDELGWTGVKEHRPGGDDAVRQPLPARPPEDSELLASHRRWIELRRARPELTTAPLEVVDKTNRTIDYRVGTLHVHLDLDGGVALREG